MPKKKKPSSTSSLDQHFWREVPIEPELFAHVEEYPNLTEEEASVLKEAKLLIQQLLFDRVVDLASNHFTEHQKVVLALIQTPDRTYSEIADILGINYTGVSHAIKGIKSKNHGKFHGGYEKKLRKICQKDEECIEYIKCILELRNNNPKYALEVLKTHDDDTDFWNNFSF